jgi:hypothetical protein
MTPEQELARRRKLVSAAKALLSLQVGIAVGAMRMVGVLRQLGRPYEESHPIFSKFIDSIPRSIPLGGARLLWNPERMLELDELLAPVEAAYRRMLMAECIRIIEIYGEDAPGADSRQHVHVSPLLGPQRNLIP